VIAQWRLQKNKYSLERLYTHLGTSRQAVHKGVKRKCEVATGNVEVLDQVQKIRSKHKKMGSRVLYSKLKDPPMGITVFERLMSEQGMTIPRSKKYIVTTQSAGTPRYPNLKNGLKVNDINQLIVGDITYYQPKVELYYIFALKDVYSGRILGLTGDTNMKADKALRCLAQMVRLRGTAALQEALHHTDGGGQYRATAYLKRLNNYGMQISQAYSSLENGCAEQLNDILKSGYLDNEEINNVQDLHRSLQKIKRLINEDRPVHALGYRTPVAYEEYIADIPIDERRIVERYDFNKERSTKNGVLKASSPGNNIDMCQETKELRPKEDGASINGIPEHR